MAFTLLAGTVHRRRAMRALIAAAALQCSGAHAQAVPHDRATALSTTLGFEAVRLPAGERMGLVGGSMLFDAGDGVWIGPAIYGAATGERGGLFVGGAEVQRRWRLGAEHFIAGLYAGGGGGAAAPVGGGLMLRPALTWLHGLGPMQAGVSLSSVRFPSGTISSRQFGLVLAWDSTFRYADAARAGTEVSDPVASGIGADRLAGTLSTYSLRGGGLRERRIGLVGARIERDGGAAPLGGAWRWGVETAAATMGNAAGYMEALASAGWDAPLAETGALRAGARVALGLGGGGALPTGGGVLVKLALGTSLRLATSWRSGIELGWLRAPDTSLHAPVAQWWLARDLEPAPGPAGQRQGTLTRTEWTAALQHYSHVERSDGADRSLQTVGLKIARYVGDHLYGTGQAHSAIAGGAGGLSIGLVGLGAATAAGASPWRVGAELLVGAAGGGGVASGGGAIAQTLGWAACSCAPGIELRVGIGAVRSRNARLSSPIVSLELGRAFSQSMP